MTSGNNKQGTPQQSDNEKKTETRCTVLPKKLDNQVVGIVNKRGYHSISEFIREAVRKLVKEWEDYDRNQQVWRMIGGTVVNEVMSKVDEKVTMLEDFVNTVMNEQLHRKKEADMLKGDPKIEAEQDDEDTDEI